MSTATLVKGQSRTSVEESFNTLVSIVIPVYNVEGFVGKCVDSILCQSHGNIQVIIVNDGSTDDSLKILETYQKEDPRIELINKQNGGLSDARNAGLISVRGDYVAFIDGDDYIHKDYIRKMLIESISTDSDIVCCGYYKVYSSDMSSRSNSVNKTFTPIEALQNLMSTNSNFGVETWNKLYKTSLFRDNDIVFPLGKINEDAFTTYKLLYLANKITCIQDNLYYYIQRPGSIMNQSFDLRRLDLLEALTEMQIFIQKNEKVLIEDFSAYEVWNTLWLLTDYVQSSSIDESIRKRIMQRIRAIPRFGNKRILFKHKFALFIAKRGINSYAVYRKSLMILKRDFKNK